MKLLVELLSFPAICPGSQGAALKREGIPIERSRKPLQCDIEREEGGRCYGVCSGEEGERERGDKVDYQPHMS
jgi:hypothetical protein